MYEKDDEPLLCENDTCISRSKLLALGTLNLLKQGRSELLSAVLAGCLLTFALLILVLVSIILTFKPGAYASCRFGRNADGKLTNIYFVKHENRIWTNEELCHIETAARHYPEFNIFIINLLTKDNAKMLNDKYPRYIDEFEDFANSVSQKKIISYEITNNSETRLINFLSEIPNVQNIDISIKKFFAGSRMSKKISKLSSDKIELAAKFQLLWDSPGISLEPLNVCELETILPFFDDEDNVDASIQIDNDIQAVSFFCQSFIDHIINEMVKYDFEDRQSLLKHALSDYCLSKTKCIGVRIVEPVSKEHRIDIICPTINSIINANNKSNAETAILR